MAHAEGTGTLSRSSDSINLDFSSDVYVSSAANTSPSAGAAISLLFTATTPVHLSLSATTHASPLTTGHSISYISLNNSTSGALLVRAGSNSSGDSSEAAQFDDWIPAGRYLLQTGAEAYLDPNPTFPQTYGASGFSGTISISVPEPASALLLLFGAAICLQRRTLRRI